MDSIATEHLAWVSGALNFLRPMSEKPRSLEYQPAPGVQQTNVSFEQREVPIRNLRPIAGAVSLEREGFQLLHAPSVLSDFEDEDKIRERYYGEAVALLKNVTGAHHVVVFDHTIRRRIAGISDRTTGAPRQPARRVHNDYTVASGPQRVRDLLGARAPELLSRRFSIINIWRPIHGPVLELPLALADAQSVTSADLVATDLVYPDRTGEIYYVKYSPQHRWYYAPRMRDEEVMLIKCYDSLEDGRARFVPHAAFEDPHTPADARPRESIELRTLVFYGG